MNAGQNQSLRDRIRESTAREILNAAESVLAERGFTATSMAAIAQVAGVAVGTLYNHFADKETLLSTLLAERRAEIFQLLDEAVALDAGRPFEARLEGFVRALFRIYDSNRRFLKIALETDHLTPKLAPVHDTQAVFRAATHLIVDRLEPIVEQGHAEGVLLAEGRTLHAWVLAGIARGVLLKRLSDEGATFESATEIVMSLFLDGARRRPS